MTLSSLARMKSAAQAATKGEWISDAYEDAFFVMASDGGMVADGDQAIARMRGTGHGRSPEQQAANSAFLADSRTAVPALLAEREELYRLIAGMIHWVEPGHRFRKEGAAALASYRGETK